MLSILTVPGPPINLAAIVNQVQCTMVNLTWDLPPTDERNGKNGLHKRFLDAYRYCSLLRKIKK